MSNAIGVIELNSIARGIEISDFMLKASQVDLVRSSTICPGKYVIIIGGDTGNVRASLAEGDKRGAECVLDTLILPNVHHQLIPAISLSNHVEARGAIGVMEFFSVTSAIKAARASSVINPRSRIVWMRVRSPWVFCSVLATAT